MMLHAIYTVVSLVIRKDSRYHLLQNQPSISYLMESKIKPFEISQKLRQIDLKTFQFQVSVIKITYVTDNFAYLQIDQSDLVIQIDVQKLNMWTSCVYWEMFIETMIKQLVFMV